MQFGFIVRVMAAMLIAGATISVQPSSARALPTPPPQAVPRPYSDTYFGTVVRDPYRWLEQLGDPQVVAFMKQENSYTRAVLDSIPGRDALLARIDQLSNAGTSVSLVQAWGGRYFYYKVTPGSNNRKLYVRQGLTGRERILVDPDRLTAGGVHYSIDYFTPSTDGRYVAYGISPGGSEDSVLHVVDATNGRPLPEAIDRTQFGAVAWRNDNRSFYYTRLPRLASNAPQTERYRRSVSFLHRLGQRSASDRPEFGFGVSQRAQIGADDFNYVIVSPVSPYVFGVINHGVQNELTVYAAPSAKVNGSATPWNKIIDVSDDVTGFDVHGNDIYMLTHHGASRYKVVRMDLAQPDFARAADVVPASEQVVTQIGVARDGLYVQREDGGIGRLYKTPLAGGPAREIALPFLGAINTLFTNPLQPGALARLTSWTKSPLWYAYDPGRDTLVDTNLVAASPVDFSQITSREVKSQSADGTMVPLSIIYKKGIALDGSHPTLLDGYGAYGITIDPAFNPTQLAWLERGNVSAECHVRGGGEYGEDWHLAGKGQTKQHTIDDFLACAQYLIANKFTSAAKLGGEGTSAGGITIGGAITQRPDLFAAALIRVGDSDSLRSETMASGPANIPEFGTVTDPQGFKALYAMDAYQHVKDGTAYPAVMLTTGANDPRVAPWEALKMAARLQSATSSRKPVLLRVDYDAGHGIGSTKSQTNRQIADEMSFLLWQFGDPGFQPGS
ncbi:MAG: S9 family peptidase [Candidatus Eremiobacteraeota bacterium]|nr:S9 family peptidase [Candidatus Eremiobacteraeota bacterium]MBC5826177.1 S9 family peptidase [Candidatus Eremiobacteraeota bacterium]